MPKKTYEVSREFDDTIEDLTEYFAAEVPIENHERDVKKKIEFLRNRVLKIMSRAE